MIEYDIISKFYGNTVTERSNVPLINHIDEGLKILEAINASEIAKKAFCLHPLLQGNEELKTNIFNPDFKDVEFAVIITTMEYRHTANNYLSNKAIYALSEIELSPLRDVNDMLVADKVQNYKDFELYHKKTHERSSELEQYFNNWLRRLNVDYNYLKSLI